MVKSLVLILSLTLGVSPYGQTEIDYQHKRLLNSLKKNEISGFSQLEEIQDNLIDKSEINGKFFKILNGNENTEVKYVFVGRVNSCRAGGCSDSKRISENIESEYFDYYIFFDSSKTVSLVDVFNYQATHGYEITSKGWLKQFVGFSGKDTLLVNKDIDGISGATISVFAITIDVQQKTQLLKSVH